MLIMNNVGKTSFFQKQKTRAQYNCKYCGKSFIFENRYLSHRCKQMQREEEFQSPIGQAAWNYYQKWMRTMKRMPPPPKSFLTSKYYRSFINFAKFAQKVDLPRPEKFIWLMVERSFQPTLWTSDDAYVLYLEFLDYKVSPLEQARLSVETLLNIADKNNIDVTDIFNVITANEIMHLLRTRRLSPWFLLNSKKFRQFYVEKTTPEQKIIIETIIRPEYWAEKFEKHPEDIKIIKRYVTEMNL